jgi:ATP-dependent exoDNAse (exonuclease V) alpha subunit
MTLRTGKGGRYRYTPARNLLYAGVTRGKRLVVLVGQKNAIAIAVRNVSGRRR